MRRMLFIPFIFCSVLIHAQWNNVQVGDESFIRSNESLEWSPAEKSDNQFDAHGNLINENRYTWNGNIWQLRSDRINDYDNRNRLIFSHYKQYSGRNTDFEYINRVGYTDNQQDYQYQEFRNPDEGRKDINIRRGTWGKGEYIREDELYEYDERILASYFSYLFDTKGNLMEDYSRFFRRDEPLYEYKGTYYYNSNGCAIGTISYQNENESGWVASDSTRIVPIIGCDNKVETYNYSYENNTWRLENAIRQEARFDENGNQTMYLQEALNGQEWDTLYYELYTYNARGDVTSFNLVYPEARVRILYEYSNNYLTTSYVVAVDERFIPGGFIPVDSIFIELSPESNLLRQEIYRRESGAFVLSNELINTYNIDGQISSREFYFRNPYQEERSLTEFAYRCDGVLLEIQRSIVDAKPATTLGNQSLERYYYLRNDACGDSQASETNLYPNPANQYVGIELPSDVTTLEVRIINTSGQPVEQYSVDTDFPYFRLDTSELAEGLYIVQLQGESFNTSSRLVVQR